MNAEKPETSDFNSSAKQLIKKVFLISMKPKEVEEEKGVTLVIREEDYIQLRNTLLQGDDLERVSFIFFGIQGQDPIKKIFVHKVLPLEDADYSSQTPMYVVPKTKKQMDIFKIFEQSKAKGLLHIHSHPFTRKAEFSSVDEKMAHGAIRSLRDYLLAGGVKSSFLFGRMVLGQDEKGFSGTIHNPETQKTLRITNLQIVGPSGIKRIESRTSLFEDSKHDSQDREILDRNIRWLGIEGQNKFAETHLVICGLGGAGSQVAFQCQGLGFKKITLIDHDRIEKSNLNRFAGASLNDVGEFKVNVIKRMIDGIGVTRKVTAVPQKVEEAQGALQKGDIIIAGVDSFKTRFDLQIWAARHLTPLIDIGSGILVNKETQKIHSMGGQVGFYIPGGPCLCCQGVIPREIESKISQEVKRATGYVQGTDLSPTSVVTINGMTASLSVDMLIKYLTGLISPATHLKCDLITNTCETYHFQKKNFCPICGPEGIEGLGEERVQITPHPRWTS